MSLVSPHNLTPRAQQVLSLAAKEARRLNHNYVGADHVILGLVRLGHSCVSLDIFLGRGITPEQLKTTIEEKMVVGEVVRDGFPSYTSHMVKVFELARRHAKKMNHEYIGTEHLVLGILSSGEGIVHEILTQDFGLTTEEFEREVLKIFQPNFAQSQAQTTL